MSTSSSDNGQSPTPSDRRSAERLLTDEEMEPYVRRKRAQGDSKRRLQGLNEEEQNVIRTSINSRERRRMHDLNDAMEELRSALPYQQDANSRRMSKINTLLLASNWIRQLTRTNETLTSELAALRSEAGKEDKPPTDVLVPVVQAVTPDCSVSRDPVPFAPHQSVQNQPAELPPTQKMVLPGMFDPKVLPMMPILPFVQMSQHICRRPFNQPCICIGCLSGGVAAIKK